jgi:hypothetical protein
VLRLWRGAGPTVTRAMAVNVFMLSASDVYMGWFLL